MNHQPCPFCGGTKLLIRRVWSDAHGRDLLRTGCEVATMTDDELEGIESWWAHQFSLGHGLLVSLALEDIQKLVAEVRLLREDHDEMNEWIKELIDKVQRLRVENANEATGAC